MAKPERMRKVSDLVPICPMVPAEPTTSTISQEKTRTTTVRRAVATSESVLRIPHFASMDVNAANTADKTAIKSHITYRSFLLVMFCLYYIPCPFFCKAKKPRETAGP